MSSVAVNDENVGASPVCRRVMSESAADLFALDLPTGRPSILRQSQADNIKKNLPKAATVCFQTPLRDPVTKRIVSPSRVGKTATVGDAIHALESLTLTSPASHGTAAVLADVPTKTNAFPDDDMPIQTRGDYAIDFDNLDSFNPFQSSGVIALSTHQPTALMSDDPIESTSPASSPGPENADAAALDETLPFNQSGENSPADDAATDRTVIIEPANALLRAHGANDTIVQLPEALPVDNADVTDSPLLPKGSYPLDFENLDAVNPFDAGGSKIQNSPPVSRKSPIRNSAPSNAEERHSGVTEIEREDKLDATRKPGGTEVSPDTAALLTNPPKEGPVLLEFTFDDGKHKPPPKRLGLKRPPLSKTKSDASKPPSVPAEESGPEIKAESCDLMTDSEAMLIPPARGVYAVDSDKFDDPNFNPFGNAAQTGGSPPPPSSSPPPPPPHDVLVVSEGPIPPSQPESYHTHSSPSSKLDETEAEAEPSCVAAEEPESLPVTETLEPCVPLMKKPNALYSLTQSAPFENPAADEEFIHGAVFMPSDLDGQIDYLAQFGSGDFKQSALRKQSLFMKFDPLLKESPKKAAVDGSDFSLPRPSLAFRMMEAARSEVRRKSQQDSPKLLDFPPPQEPPVVPDPMVLKPRLPAPQESEQSDDIIVDVLMYTQKDLTTALEKLQKQAEENEADLKSQLEKMTLDNQHMVLIVSEYEAVITQITAEHKQKEELAQSELSRVLQEKQQLATELSNLERSFSDVVKRLDRTKEVMDGFKKNEETLKQCAQSYLARLQKEEQRYQMLKTHAEEKMDQANKQIAEVRSKMAAEITAFQVQLRREQLKVQSLERNLEQKTKEVEVITKLCDELISKVQH